MRTEFTSSRGLTLAPDQPQTTKRQFNQKTFNQSTEMKTKEKTMIPKLFRYGASLLTLGLFLLAPAARAQIPIPASSQFDLTGFLQKATVDNVADNLSGGTLTVNGHLVIVPRNLLVLLPANQLSWAQLFQQAPLPYGTGVGGNGQSGMALNDIPAPLASYEVHVAGNRVGDTYIAGLVDIAQQGLNSGWGYINYIDYANAEMRVGGVLGDPGTGARVRINDPVGRYGRIQSPDPRFTVDSENPTIKSETGYPMGLPDLAGVPNTPPITDDPFRPQTNRPRMGNQAFPFTLFTIAPGEPLTQWTMRNPAVAPVVGLDETDPMFEAPFEIGDFVTYAGTLVKDGAQPTAGPMPLDPAQTYISAHTITASLGIHTSPGTVPAYIAIDVTILGVGGVTPLGLGEAAARTKFEGFSTDETRPVTLWGMDQACDTGVITDRSWGSIGVDPGPPAGAVQGRWRFTPSRALTMPPSGAFLPATRMMRAVTLGAWPPVAPATGLSGNGLTYGQYQAPILEYIFPENVPGTPLPPNNFDTFPFLSKGSGPLAGGLATDIVGQLQPWPGIPIPATCSGGVPTPLLPVAFAGPNQSVASQSIVTLDGLASFDPNGFPLTGFQWTQVIVGTEPTVTLSTPAAAVTSFAAPAVPFNTPAVTLTFQLVVTSSAGSSAPSTLTVTVNPPAAAGTPIANAGPAQTVGVAVPVTLNGTASSDPNGAPLTYSWVQTSGTSVGALANTATPSFTSTTPPLGTTEVLSFTLTVNNGVNSASDLTTVNVVGDPAVAPVANAGLDQTVASDAIVTLNGTGSILNGLTATYNWTQVSGTPVILGTPNSSVTTFGAPHVPFGSPAATLVFQLTVTTSGGVSSDLVNVTVNPAALLAPVANAGLDQTVNSGAIVTLRGVASDPNNPALPLTYLWTQTGGLAFPVTLSANNVLQPTFTAPIIPAGPTPGVLVFDLKVSNSGGAFTIDTVVVSVNPSADTVIITAVEYRTQKQRLTVNVTDSFISPTLVLTLKGQLNWTDTPMQNLGGGLYQLVLVGVAQPSTVTVVSGLGGTATAPPPPFRIRN